MERKNTSAESPLELQSTPCPPLSGGHFKSQVILRLFATMLSIGAISLMMTSGQSTYVFSIEYKARFTYSSAYRFVVGTDIVVCAFSVLSVIAVYAFSKLNPASQVRKCDTFCFVIFLLDLAVMVLAISGSAASTAIGYVALNGQEQTAWIEICSRVHMFCNKIMASILLSYLAFLCFFVLAILSFLHGRVRTSRAYRY